MIIHANTHPTLDVEGCQKCRWVSVTTSAHATPSRRPEAVAMDRKEYAMEKDRDAYQRLRRQGYQPPQIAASEAKERFAKTAEEINRPI